jgi:assimilatory nitrate reductase catalytic subunit
MHWGPEFLGGVTSTGERLAGVNALTSPAYCPTSKQPELKHAAVKVLKADLPLVAAGRGLAARGRSTGRARGAQAADGCVPVCQLRAVFQQRAPWKARPGASARGVLFRAAAYEAPTDEVVARIEALLGLDAADTLRYADRKKGPAPRDAVGAAMANRRCWRLFVLAGDTSAQAWVKTLLQEELPAQAYGRLLLVPGAKAPVAVQSRGKQVCTCFNVTGPAIDAHLAGCSGTDGERLASLQSALKCGTNCGSCVPELKRMVKAVIPLRKAA